MVGTCLVMGATGSLGAALVRRLAECDLRVLVRDADAFRGRFPDLDADVREGDLTEVEDIDDAIDDVDTVFHCACMPYFHWGDLVGHTRRLITAAEEEEKVVDIVFPGNVLVYGDVGPGTVREEQPHEPGTKKGVIRVNVERQLREANARGECRTTVARLPDLYGPGVTSRCMRRIFPAAIDGTTVSWPGDLDAEREFVHVDDAATAMVRLAESDVAWGKAWHVPGPGTTTAREFIGMAFEKAGNEPDVREAIGVAINMSDRFTKDAREEKELLYTFLRPPILDGSAWRRAFGADPPSTPYGEGLEGTVKWWCEHRDDR
jgi:nucleoside-diphosphate-sugar epimerase